MHHATSSKMCNYPLTCVQLYEDFVQLDGVVGAKKTKSEVHDQKPTIKNEKREMACLHDLLPELLGYINVDDLKVTDVMLWVVLLP